MPHVVTDHCEECRYTKCVAVCPVDCFHGSAERLYIDPDACIDCAACVPACPVGAISDSFDLGSEGETLVEINRQMSHRFPVVNECATPLPTADAKRLALGH